MGRKVPKLTTDEDADRFLDQDLSDLDFAQFKPVRFEFEPKSERVNMRLPATLLQAVKASAAAEGIPYQCFISPGARESAHREDCNVEAARQG